MTRAEGKRPGLDDRGTSLEGEAPMTRVTITSRPRMGNLCPRHGARPPLAWRRRRARLPPALGLVGLRRPHRHSSHHGPRLAACRVVAHRDEGITAFSTAPRPFRPGRGGRKNPGAAVAAPGVQGQQPNRNAAAFALAQAAALKVFLLASPSQTAQCRYAHRTANFNRRHPRRP